MSHLRAALKFVLISVLTFGATIATLVAVALARDPVAKRRAGIRYLRPWARRCARAIGMRVTIRGTPPQGAFIAVSNHLSYCDIYLIGMTSPTVFVAKAEISRWPLLGAVTDAAGTLYIDRSRIRAIPQVVEQMDRIREAGLGVHFFPEGTTTDGSHVAPFRASLLEIAARAERPVHFAAIRYTAPPGWPPACDSICWWGDATLLDHLWGLLRLPYFEAEIVFGEEPVLERDRKELAHRLQEAVRGALEPDARA
ncbi:MAG: 1-acyl-sn-glycerol-3-phosphate acyltransferase [Acidobacteria bacterium]|nr:1-acyl-sn-glycerol-3-phosphate acyltransferase [Acidobacteriota bacterium]